MTNEELVTGLRHIAHTMERNGHSYYQHVVEGAIEALEQQPCEDCISRQAVKQIGMNQYETDDYGRGFGDAICEVLDLPSVTPKPKKGKWIITYPDGARVFKCNQCNEYASIHHVTNYCPNWGAYMKEDSE